MDFLADIFSAGQMSGSSLEISAALTAPKAKSSISSELCAIKVRLNFVPARLTALGLAE